MFRFWTIDFWTIIRMCKSVWMTCAAVQYIFCRRVEKENPKNPIRVFLSYLFYSSFCKMHFDPINTYVIGYRTMHYPKSGLPNTLICIAVISREMILYFLFCITGGAVNCASVHLGEIRPGGVRGNHRHYTCNETFFIWGAKTLFRVCF